MHGFDTKRCVEPTAKEQRAAKTCLKQEEKGGFHNPKRGVTHTYPIGVTQTCTIGVSHTPKRVLTASVRRWWRNTPKRASIRRNPEN